jgi:hypothetical protein
VSLFDEIIADGPLGYWREVDGIDHSGNGLNLTAFGGPVAADSLDSSDPTNASILFGDGQNLWNPEHYAALNLTTPMTLWAVIDPSVVGDQVRDIAGKSTQYRIYLDADGKAHGVIEVGGVPRVVDGATPVPVDTISDVAIRYSGAAVELYVNGALDGSTAVSGPISTIDAASFTIALNSGSQSFHGRIDEVALFDFALDPARIAAYHVAATGASLPSAVSVKFSGGAGNQTGAASLGGPQGATLSTSLNALFGTPSNADRVAGLADYRAIYVVAPEDITALRAWVVPSTQADSSEAIGTEAAPAQAQVIPDAKTAPAGVVFGSPVTEGTGLVLGDVASGAAVPLWIRRLLDAGAADGIRTFQIALSWVGAAGAQTASISVAYRLTAPVTLYVDADNPAATDIVVAPFANLRAQAQDPTRPLKTIEPGIWSVQAADTLQIEPALNANPDDPHDTSVYAAPNMHDATPPAFDASGGDPIRIVGHVVGGVRPKVFNYQGRGLVNWQWENIQWGYDRGSGFDHDTGGLFSFCYDTVFRNCVWTGGTFWVRGFGGLLWLDGCEVYHPYTGANFFSGVGMWVLETDAGPVPPTRPGTFRVTGSHVEDCLGEDGFQLSSFEAGSKIEIGGYIDADGQAVVDGNVFKDLPQTGGAHTDATQCFGCAADITIVGNEYINCASPIILSDGRFSGRVIIGKNVFGEGSVWAIQIEGCDNAWILHNTCRTIWYIAVYTKEPGVSQNVRIVNNVVPLLELQANDLDPASVIENNVTYQTPGAVTAWGTQLDGVPEWGTSARMAPTGLTEAFELANTPTISPGIGEGRSLAGLGLTPQELAYFDTDLLGRPYAAQRDEDRYQLVTIDPKASLDPLVEGLLWPRILFTVTLNGIKDTQGSTIDPTSWQFYSGGAAGAAVSSADGDQPSPAHVAITDSRLSSILLSHEGVLQRGPFYQGSKIRVTAVFTDQSAEPIDPPEVEFRIEDPTGAVDVRSTADVDGGGILKTPGVVGTYSTDIDTSVRAASGVSDDPDAAVLVDGAGTDQAAGPRSRSALSYPARWLHRP